ncbi:MAG: Holliday junction resolvase RuvX [Bacilli bacterium]|nr:Holliday junction resolvase RuvX [Bacilli bacterium]MDD4607773.1 Holliday junction resolvase RuvX [Bacilli bacterium]
MRYLGLDLGTKTLGLSISDQTGTIASSLKTISFENEDYDSLLPILKQIIEEYDIKELVLGLPKNMNNTIGERAEKTLAFQKKLESFLNMKVSLMDERLSTVSATNYLLEANMSRKKRKTKVDKIAANIILQSYLDKRKGENENER